MLKKNQSNLPHPRKAREALGLSQRALAKLIPTTQSSVCQWETAGCYPKHASLRAAMLRVLGLAS